MLDEIMTDIKAGKISDADNLWAKTEGHWDTDLKGCKDDYSEWQDLDKYSKNTMARKDAKDYLNKRYTKFKAFIDKLSGEMLMEWGNGDYRAAGMYDGQIAMYMDLAPNPYHLEDECVGCVEADKMDPTAPAQFMAGWLYGVSGQTIEFRDEVMKCYKQDDNITKDFYDGMAAYMKGDSDAGTKAFNDARKRYHTAYAGCDKKITKPFVDATDKMDALVSRKDWEDIEEKIYKENKKVVDQNTTYEFKEWKEGVFYNSGMFAGATDLIFLKNAPKKPSSIFHPFAHPLV